MQQTQENTVHTPNDEGLLATDLLRNFGISRALPIDFDELVRQNPDNLANCPIDPPTSFLSSNWSDVVLGVIIDLATFLRHDARVPKDGTPFFLSDRGVILSTEQWAVISQMEVYGVMAKSIAQTNERLGTISKAPEVNGTTAMSSLLGALLLASTACPTIFCGLRISRWHTAEENCVQVCRGVDLAIRSDVKLPPNATLAELLATWERSPEEQLWFTLESDPLRALADERMEGLVKEDPRRFDEVETFYAQHWIQKTLPLMSPTQAQLWACDCLDHVLYLYQTKYPDDSRLREVVQITRDYAGANDGNALRCLEKASELAMTTQSELESAYNANLATHRDPNAINENLRDPLFTSAKWVATAAVLLQRPGECASACEVAMGCTTPGKDADKRGDEFVWQWYRMLDYLRNEL